MCPDVTFRHLLAFSADPVNFPPQPLSSVLCLGLTASLDTSTHSLGLGAPSSSCSCPSSLKVQFSAALSTQLSSLGTHLLIPIETCLGSRRPFDSKCSMSPLLSAYSITLNTHSALGQVVVVPPTSIPREALGSCVIGVSNELPPLHPVCPLCLCMCVVWRWAALLDVHGASPAQTRGTRNENGGYGRHGPGRARAEAMWPRRPPPGTASGRLMALLSAQLPKPSASFTPMMALRRPAPPQWSPVS